MKIIRKLTIGGLGSRVQNAYGTVVEVWPLAGVVDVIRNLGELAALVVRGEFPFDDSQTTVGVGAALTLASVDADRDDEDTVDNSKGASDVEREQSTTPQVVTR